MIKSGTRCGAGLPTPHQGILGSYKTVGPEFDRAQMLILPEQHTHRASSGSVICRTFEDRCSVVPSLYFLKTESHVAQAGLELPMSRG